MSTLPSPLRYPGRHHGRLLAVGAAAVLMVSAVLGQNPLWDPQTDPLRPQDPTRQDPDRQDPGRSGTRPTARHPLQPDFRPLPNEDPFRPGQAAPQGEFGSDVPEYVGFPIFPPDFTGWSGHFPLPGSLLESPQFTGTLPLLPDRVEDWPSWVRLELSDWDEPFSPDRAMLIRDGDRVWYLDATESAFEPLAYHDRVRVVRPGARVQVRTKGSFQMIFHGGGRADFSGRGDLLVEDLNAERVALRLYDFTRVWIYGRERATEVSLPDGSVLRLPAADEGLVHDVFLSRDRRLGTVYNPGPGSPSLTGPFGDAVIPPGHRVRIGLEPRVGLVRSAAWRREGEVSVRDEGRVRTVEAFGAGGAVEWSGVRARLPVGARLRIDPLGPDGADSDFPELRNNTQ